MFLKSYLRTLRHQKFPYFTSPSDNRCIKISVLYVTIR